MLDRGKEPWSDGRRDMSGSLVMARTALLERAGAINPCSPTEATNIATVRSKE